MSATTDIRKQRIALLAEVDQLQGICLSCATRKHFNDLKDATGLSHACKACPVGQEMSGYGEKLSTLLNDRKKR